MFAAIRTAKKSIYLEMYVFQNDTKGFDFLAALKQKAEQGIRTVVVLDAFGSAGLSSAETAELRAAGVEVLFFSFWFRRLHRKVLIVDEQTVFLGGVNISGEYAPWKDLQMRVTGKRLVQSALRSFARVYHECGGKDIHLLAVGSKIPPLKKARTWFLEHGVLGKRAELRRHYEENISAAKNSIVLVTPYFIPRRWLIAKLHGAILRGVHVEVIIPRHTDHPEFLDHLNYYFLTILSRLGAVCYLFTDMNHAKVMLVDGHIATVGSQNLDSLSFDWNAEAGVVFDGPAMTRDLSKILDSWKSESLHFTPEMYTKRWFDRLIPFIF